jgi:hypothetical protein
MCWYLRCSCYRLRGRKTLERMKATYEQRHIATSNYLEDGVKDDVNLADKTIMKDDGTTEAA